MSMGQKQVIREASEREELTVQDMFNVNEIEYPI
jgi:hypothetical protein